MLLDLNQERAISALLTSTSVTRAAKKVGISRETLTSWLKEPTFRDEYRRARTRLVELTIGRLVGAGTMALRKLLKLLNDPDAKVQLGAAKAILENVFKGQIAELGAEVEAFLKAQMEASRDQHARATADAFGQGEGGGELEGQRRLPGGEDAGDDPDGPGRDDEAGGPGAELGPLAGELPPLDI